MNKYSYAIINHLLHVCVHVYVDVNIFNKLSGSTLVCRVGSVGRGFPSSVLKMIKKRCLHSPTDVLCFITCNSC